MLVAATALDSNVSCFGGSDGSATASAAGGTTAYSFAWSSGANTATAANLTAGTYTVTVIDANNVLILKLSQSHNQQYWLLRQFGLKCELQWWQRWWS